MSDLRSTCSVSVASWINARTLDQLLRSPNGPAFFLRYLADVERDELDIFTELLARVPDAELQQLVRRHRDDEARHAAMLGRCAAAAGASPVMAPVELNMPYRLGQALGGIAESFLQ